MSEKVLVWSLVFLLAMILLVGTELFWIEIFSHFKMPLTFHFMELSMAFAGWQIYRTLRRHVQVKFRRANAYRRMRRTERLRGMQTLWQTRL
jgi:hypothetical protein